MTFALAILLSSLLGSFHCAAMCGVFACGYAASGDEKRSAATHVAYHLGRLASYLMLGATAGAIGVGLDRAGTLAGATRPAAIVSGTLMLVWALYMMARTLGMIGGGARSSIAGTFIDAARRTFGGLLLMLRGKPAAVRAGAIGLLTTLLPCGWLYIFVVSAAGTGDPLSAVALMLFFWAGTVPALLLVAVGVQRWFGRLAVHMPMVAAGVVMVLGILALSGRLHMSPLAQSHAVHAAAAATPVTGLSAVRPEAGSQEAPAQRSARGDTR